MNNTEIEKMMNRQDSCSIDEWGVHITCPYCKESYTHFEDVLKQESDSGAAWEGRGGAARIAMYCEHCPNLFYVRVGEHKGFSYLNIEKSYNVSNFHKTWPQSTL